MFGVERTRTLLKPVDPARPGSVAPPRLSARDLIDRAEAAAEPVARHRQARPTRRLVLTAGTLAVAAAGAAAIAETFRRSSAETGEFASPAQPEPGLVLVPVAYGSDVSDAGDRLRALAGRLVDAEHDNHTGRYMYHHTKSWDPGVVMASVGRPLVGFAREFELWQTPDGKTGKQVMISMEPQFPDQESRDYWQRNHKPGPTATVTHDPRSDFLPPMQIPPLPSDRAQLAGRLQVRYGGGTVVKQLGGLYGLYVVPRRTRAEILRVLADVPGFRWRGQVVDRAGRKGVAITFDDREHDQQSLLIFAPETGELLAYEVLSLSPVRISMYQLILRTGWTDELG
ncbi:CU044_5270 family protein [Micromonospora musae]|uniref:CU044_5270 family protein n=1 Tax=Micromonospora musae TaxID=1894970 RepID=UPI00341332EB